MSRINRARLTHSGEKGGAARIAAQELGADEDPRLITLIVSYQLRKPVAFANALTDGDAGHLPASSSAAIAPDQKPWAALSPQAARNFSTRAFSVARDALSSVWTQLRPLRMD
jgi:hypothetical protein